MRRIVIESGAVALFEEWYNPTIFKATIKRFQDKYVWKPFGIVVIDGKTVEKRKAEKLSKGNPLYQIVYIDPSTGLPIKEEHYDDKNLVTTTVVYFFDHVNDPNGDKKE